MESSLFQEIVRDLEQHEESIRIKKLIFCVSKKYWENDLNILNRISLTNLIAELFETNLNIDILSACLYKTVKTLNRQEVYTAIANIIISKLSQLYSDSEESTQILLVDLPQKLEQNICEDLVEKVAVYLEEHKESIRIKKLMFSACKKYWEKDLKAIENYSLKDLVLELRHLNHTLEQLKESLDGLVDNLNRKNLYSVVADIIVSKFSSLYKSQEQEETQIYNTQIIETAIRSIELTKFEPKLDIKEQANTGNCSVTRIHKDWQGQLRRTYDKFELRMKLMQYANPLKVKILLFSVIYPQLNGNGSYWLKLKTCTLDDLLSALLSTYQSISELESKLTSIAESMSEPDANIQTASAIVQSIKPLYM